MTLDDQLLEIQNLQKLAIQRAKEMLIANRIVSERPTDLLQYFNNIDVKFEYDNVTVIFYKSLDDLNAPDNMGYMRMEVGYLRMSEPNWNTFIKSMIIESVNKEINKNKFGIDAEEEIQRALDAEVFKSIVENQNL